MSVGIILSCYNHFYFRRYVSVFNEFLPQFMFLQVRSTTAGCLAHRRSAAR